MRLKGCLKYIVVFIAIFTALPAAAQDTLHFKVRSGFMDDSVKVGMEIKFYLSAQYPRNQNILFPDTAFTFGSFEFKRKEYFPTRTSQAGSYDSVIYYLTTFEVDSVQYLSLPVFQVNPQDCTIHRSNQDSVMLIHTVKALPDSLTADLPLKATVEYQDVSYPFNYQVFIIMMMVLLITVAVIWFLFGKKIRKQLRLKNLQKAHQKFLEIYARRLETLKQNFSPTSAEAALTEWKRYMERLNAKPYTKLTTREMMALEKDESLGKNLRAIDGSIYGHNADVLHPLENLKLFAEQRFIQKIEEVKHG